MHSYEAIGGRPFRSLSRSDDPPYNPRLAGSRSRERWGLRGPKLQAGLVDAHSLDPAAVFSFLKTLGGEPGRVLIVGCEPARTEEEIGLSEPAAQAVDEAVRLVRDVIDRMHSTAS